MTMEDARTRLRQKLEDAYGVEEASILLDRPPGGWSDLVTNQMLDAKLAALEHKLLAEMATLRGELISGLDRRFRAQTWALATLLVAGLGAITAAVRL